MSAPGSSPYVSVREARPSELLPVFVIAVDHAHSRRRRACAFKQAALGREIFLKSLVIVEMVAREIRENRHRERASPQTVHRQRVRTGFEHRVRASRANNFRQIFLQIERFRSGVRRGQRLAHQAVADRAQQADFAARRAQNRIHQISGRGLAVCPGHANEFQHFRGAPHNNWPR